MNPEDTNLEKKESNSIKALRTYQGDVEQALSKNNSSATTIMIAEQKRREERPELAPKPKMSLATKNSTFFTLGVSLLFLGIIAIGGVYYWKTNDRINVEEANKSLIGFNKEEYFQIASLTTTQFGERISQLKNTPGLEINTILYINIVDVLKNPEPIEKVLTLLSPKVPNELTRSLSEKYMIGVYSFDTNEPFIVLKVSDYANSYASMLKWEKDMAKDMAKAFSIEESLFTTEFIDEEFKNKDLRVLKSSGNKSVLLYSFIDRNTLVITSNENILSAILGKYLISQQAR